MQTYKVKDVTDANGNILGTVTVDLPTTVQELATLLGVDPSTLTVNDVDANTAKWTSAGVNVKVG